MKLWKLNKDKKYKDKLGRGIEYNTDDYTWNYCGDQYCKKFNTTDKVVYMSLSYFLEEEWEEIKTPEPKKLYAYKAKFPTGNIGWRVWIVFHEELFTENDEDYHRAPDYDITFPFGGE